MPLDRVAGEHFGVRVGHSDGPRERSCVRGPPPLRVQSGKGLRGKATVVGVGTSSVPRVFPRSQQCEVHHGSVLPPRIDPVSQR